MSYPKDVLTEWLPRDDEGRIRVDLSGTAEYDADVSGDFQAGQGIMRGQDGAILATVTALPDSVESRDAADLVRGSLLAVGPGSTNWRQIPILMYHVVSSASAFGTDLDRLLAWGYETITHDQLHAYLTNGHDPVAAELPPKPVLIGFDDGGMSNYTNAYPALVERGMKATMYLVPDWMDDVIAGQGPFLEATHFTWANAVTMRASGLIDFQSHSLHHLDARTLSGPGTSGGNGSGAGADFLAAKARIEEMIPGQIVRHQAQPYGSFNAAVTASLRAAGCLSMRTVGIAREFDGSSNGAPPHVPVRPGTDPMILPVAGTTALALQAANYHGTADQIGNLVQDSHFRAAALGWTLNPNWAIEIGVLPDGSTGPFLRGTGTAGATPAASPTMPIGQHAVAQVSGWFRTDSGITSPRVLFETYKLDGVTSSAEQSNVLLPGSPTSGWKYVTGVVSADASWAFARLKVVHGGGVGTRLDVWGLRVTRAL